METFINSIPESVATAILTAAFTGVIVFFLQKRIESSFGEKMEALKANLQKSLFEHQTKFSTTYQKRVEAIEILYHKFIDLRTHFNRILIDIRKSLESNSEPSLINDDEEFNGFLQKYFDFVGCFANSRLFLSAGEIDEMHTLLNNIFHLIELMQVAAMIDNEEITPSYIISINEQIKKSRLGIQTIDVENPSATWLFNEIVIGMNNQTDILEKLYKSVADSK